MHTCIRAYIHVRCFRKRSGHFSYRSHHVLLVRRSNGWDIALSPESETCDGPSVTITITITITIFIITITITMIIITIIIITTSIIIITIIITIAITIDPHSTSSVSG